MNEPLIQFFVPGTPRPGGSKKAFPVKKKTGERITVIVDAGGASTKEWRAAAALAAFEAYSGKPLTGPLRVEYEFIMPRPKSHYRTGKCAGELRPDAPYWHTSAPDKTKLTRSTEDALTGILWRDDAQNVSGGQVKHYGDTPGCMVRVWEFNAAKQCKECE